MTFGRWNVPRRVAGDPVGMRDGLTLELLLLSLLTPVWQFPKGTPVRIVLTVFKRLYLSLYYVLNLAHCFHVQ